MKKVLAIYLMMLDLATLLFFMVAPFTMESWHWIFVVLFIMAFPLLIAIQPKLQDWIFTTLDR